MLARRKDLGNVRVFFTGLKAELFYFKPVFLVMFFLCIHNGKERMVEITSRKVIIGRPSSTMGMPDLNLQPDKNVSRRHAQVTLESGVYWIEDLGSRLGVLVNGLRLKAKRQIKFGDRILIGRTEVKLVPSDSSELVVEEDKKKAGP